MLGSNVEHLGAEHEVEVEDFEVADVEAETLEAVKVAVRGKVFAQGMPRKAPQGLRKTLVQPLRKALALKHVQINHSSCIVIT